jgi:hypothetical protein
VKRSVLICAYANSHYVGHAPGESQIQNCRIPRRGVTLKPIKIAILYLLFGAAMAALFLAINPSMPRTRFYIGTASAMILQAVLRYEIKSDVRAVLHGEKEIL